MRYKEVVQDIYGGGEDATYWMSISDLMAGVLIVFILTLTYYMLTYSLKTAELTDTYRLRQELLETIERELREKGISELQVQIDYEHGVLRLGEGILFATGSAQVKERGKDVISILGPVLRDVLWEDKYRKRVETVFVEGHTDARRIHNIRFEDNLELSTKRAINAWRELIRVATKLDELKNGNQEHVFSCSGYGETRPIASNETKEGMSKNRRIDFRFSMSPPRRDEDEREAILKDISSQAPEIM